MDSLYKKIIFLFFFLIILVVIVVVFQYYLSSTISEESGFVIESTQGTDSEGDLHTIDFNTEQESTEGKDLFEIVENLPGVSPSRQNITTDQKISKKQFLSYKNNEYGFSLAYPKGVSFIDTTEDNYPIEGAPHVNFGGVIITIPPKRDVGYHPNATDLEDYSENYITHSSCSDIEPSNCAESSYSKVVIHESKLFRNETGVRGLYQVYSTGEYRNGAFYADGEYDDRNYHRVVFWDKKGVFIILKNTGENTDLLQQIAQTFIFTETLQ